MSFDGSYPMREEIFIDVVKFTSDDICASYFQSVLSLREHFCSFTVLSYYLKFLLELF